MGETTEPTREQLIAAIDGLVHNTDAPQWMCENEANGTHTEWTIAVMRLALRTLDAEAKLDEVRHQGQRWLSALTEATKELAEAHEATERAEKAERERDETRDLLIAQAEGCISFAWTDDVDSKNYRSDVPYFAAQVAVPVRDFFRALREWTVIDALRTKLADAERRIGEVERERDEEGRLRTEWGALYTDMVRQRDDWHGAAHAADERAAVSSELREAAEAERDTIRTALADAERRIAELSPPTVPTTDERLDMETVAVLLAGKLARERLAVPTNRAKGVPQETTRALLMRASAEVGEAIDAIDRGLGLDAVLSEIGDAHAFLGIAAWRAIR